MAYDQDFYSYLADPLFAEGLYLTSPWAWWSEDNGGVEHARGLLGSESWVDWSYLPLAGSLDLARRAFENILLESEDTAAITPQAVADALENLDGYPVLDGLFVVDHTGGQRTLEELRTWQVGAAPGELILLGDYAPLPDLSEVLATPQP
jgi:hypothetical protein